MIKKYGDIIVGGFYIILAIGLYVTASNIQLVVINSLGPQFIPKVIAIIFFTLGTMLLINGVKYYKMYDATKILNDEVTPSYIRLFLTLFLMSMYILLLRSVGFVPMTFVYIIAQIYLLTPKEKYNKNTAITVFLLSAISSISLYYLFYNVFKVFLPQGIWF